MMLRLIRFLITGDGHLHKWRATAQGNFHSRYAIISYEEEGVCVYAVCEHCGKRKHFKHSKLGDWEKP